MSLGDRVRGLREKLGMNQKQLSEASEITQATISRIEAGKVKELRSEALKRLALALGVTVDYLVGKTDELSPRDIVGADREAEYIFRGYEKLSVPSRKQLKAFVRFLEGQEKGGTKSKR